LVGVGPEFLDAGALDSQQRAARSVGLRDEDPVAYYAGTTGVYAFEGTGPPSMVKNGFSLNWIDSEEPGAGEQEAPAFPVYCGQDRAGVAGQVLACLVANFSGYLVEGHQSRLVWLESAKRDLVAAGRAAADHDEEQVAFHDGRAADAEEILDDAEFL